MFFKGITKNYKVVEVMEYKFEFDITKDLI
jgi:hypothetical protein